MSITCSAIYFSNFLLSFPKTEELFHAFALLVLASTVDCNAESYHEVLFSSHWIDFT